MAKDGQARARTGFRIAGIVLVVVGGLLLVVGLGSLFSTMSTESMDGPKYFWMAFVGLPLLAVGGWCLQAGYIGAATRYVAGETVPVVKDSLDYLAGRSKAGGRACTRCGTAEEDTAHFCSNCGTAFA